MDKCLAALCAHADELNDKQVKRAVELALHAGDTRIEIMKLHIWCCRRTRNILKNIHQSKDVYKGKHTWIWEPEQCFG